MTDINKECVLDFDIDKIFDDLSKQKTLPYVYYQPNYNKIQPNHNNYNFKNTIKYINWLQSLFYNKDKFNMTNSIY